MKTKNGKSADTASTGNGTETTVQNEVVETATAETKKAEVTAKAPKKAAKKTAAKKPAAKKPAEKVEKSEKAPRHGKKPLRKDSKAKTKVAAKTAKAPVARKTSKTRTADNSNRNFGRIKVLGKELPKGRAVLAVIQDYVEKKKPTAAQLKAAFPDELLKNYGITKDAAAAKKASAIKKRYFVNPEDLIKTKDGKTVAVGAGFSTENIKPFIKHAKTLGYTMTMSAK